MYIYQRSSNGQNNSLMKDQWKFRKCFSTSEIFTKHINTQKKKIQNKIYVDKLGYSQRT